MSELSARRFGELCDGLIDEVMNYLHDRKMHDVEVELRGRKSKGTKRQIRIIMENF